MAILVLAAAWLLLPSSAFATNVLNTFNSDSQGWLVAFDTDCSTPNPHPATYVATGGNPGGYIRGTDSESPPPTPGNPDNCPWVAASNSSFSGQLRANYGGTISVDVLHPAGAEFGGNVNLIDAQGNSLYNQGATLPAANTWTTYAFTLTETAPGWTYAVDSGPVGPPTKAQFFGVLEDLAQVQTYGDLSSNSRGDQTGLDNIQLSEPVVPLDSDGDGVLNAADNCPTVVGPASNNGCPLPPDTDGDGVPDTTDNCPTVVGPASNNGCPLSVDADGDGVPDTTDQCPTVAGPASNNGCPQNQPPPDIACEKATAKLQKAKDNLKKLKRNDASSKKIKKAKAAVKKAKAAVKKECD